MGSQWVRELRRTTWSWQCFTMTELRTTGRLGGVGEIAELQGLVLRQLQPERWCLCDCLLLECYLQKNEPGPLLLSDRTVLEMPPVKDQPNSVAWHNELWHETQISCSQMIKSKVKYLMAINNRYNETNSEIKSVVLYRDSVSTG